MATIELRRRTVPERLAYLAGKLREGDRYRESVALALEVLADEMTGADAVNVAVAPHIPMGCICAYTWGGIPGRLIRNGPLLSCTADHEAAGV